MVVLIKRKVVRDLYWDKVPFAQVIHDTRKTVFDHISKHREGNRKYDAKRNTF